MAGLYWEYYQLLLVDTWGSTSTIIASSASAPLTSSVSLGALLPGTFYDLRVEHRHMLGNASVRLEGSAPSFPRAVLPASMLFAPAHIVQGGMDIACGAATGIGSCSPWALTVTPGAAVGYTSFAFSRSTPSPPPWHCCLHQQQLAGRQLCSGWGRGAPAPGGAGQVRQPEARGGGCSGRCAHLCAWHASCCAAAPPHCSGH